MDCSASLQPGARSRGFVRLASLSALSAALCSIGCSAAEGENGGGAAGQGPEEVGVASAAIIADPICEQIGALANGAFAAQVSQTLHEATWNMPAIDLPLYAHPIATRMKVWRMLDHSIDRCNVRIKLDVSLDRLWPRNGAHGSFVLKGTVYAAKRNVVFEGRPDLPPRNVENLACLGNTQTESWDLSDTNDLGEQIVEFAADQQEGRCFPVGNLWDLVDFGVAARQSEDPTFPSLEYEWLDDIAVPCNGQCPSLKEPGGHREFFDYSIFSTQVGTALHQTGDDFDFALADNDDLFAIKKFNTGSGMTEVHVLTAESNYQAFSLNTATALGQTGGNVEFALLPNRDLMVLIKSGTGTASTEVHVLSASSNYQSFSLQTGTALGETDDNVELEVAENGDLYAIIQSGSGTATTEVHVLSAASNYQEFSLHTGTALGETGDDWEFVLMDNGDVAAIFKNHNHNTGSDRTEVHVLDAANRYQSFRLQVPTAQGFSDHRFEYLAADNRDIVQIVKEGGSSGMTQLHRLVH